MTIGAEERACMILEGLSCQLSDGQVDYAAFGGQHEFVITHAGARFKVRFAEHKLVRKSIEELQVLVEEVVARVRARTSPGVLRSAA